jgi:DNA-binding NtrC family response regulator
MDLRQVKQRFEIIGNSPKLNNALETAIRVAPTDINVLIQGESGVGKESFSKIIHQMSHKKHGPFIAVNCGAIPEGTIDSELFGHEKGAFTGAHEKRKGYFETVNGGTIFLDEVGELPLGTQSRLLRILENGEFIKVGSSQVQKTDVRIVAATNRDLLERAKQGKFREDLYYRLSTVPIRVPKLSDRKEDIVLLFMKFASVFADKYKMPEVQLSEGAARLLQNHPWPGNIRQLKNVAEQISVLVNQTDIDEETLRSYLPPAPSQLPVLFDKSHGYGDDSLSERDIFYKVLVDLKKDVTDLKGIVVGLLENPTDKESYIEQNKDTIQHILREEPTIETMGEVVIHEPTEEEIVIDTQHVIAPDESLSLEEQELNMIKRALSKHNGRRKKAALELGISERTLYRKIKQYELD